MKLKKHKHPPEPEPQAERHVIQDTLHCPQCGKLTAHRRTVSNGYEVYTCTRCGHVQTYAMA